MICKSNDIRLSNFGQPLLLLYTSMYQTHILSNGLKIIHQHTKSKAAWCGLIIGVGSRDAEPHEKGIAHFIEHVIFKGTSKRKAFHILNRIESLGGELNAYTTKEDTCIYASFLPQYYSRTLELFSDVIFNSIFPEKEIEKEKEVVIDEINSYKDSPGEQIFDDFETLVYPNHQFGYNILGDEESVKSFTREDVLHFVKRYYVPNNMVISSVGDIDFSKLIRLIEKNFGAAKSCDIPSIRIAPIDYLPQRKVMDMDNYQAHCIIGNIAYTQTEQKRVSLSMLVNILGGSGMNSRLNLGVREKYGLTYTIEANYTTYSDTGIFNIYFGSDEQNVDRCIKLCQKQMLLLMEKPLTKQQLERAQRQMIGQILLSSENYEAMMLAIGKSFLVYGKVDETDLICQEINEIKAEEMQQVAQEIFALEKQSILIFK